MGGNEHVCSEKQNISNIMDRLVSLEKTRERTNVLIELFTTTTSDLSKTMKEVEKTMVSIKHSLDGNEKKTNELSAKLDNVVVNQEKNKIDIRDIVRNWLTKGILGGLGVYGGYEIIVKLSDKV